MLLGSWRLARAVLHGLHGVVIVLLRFPTLPPAGRHARIAWWSAKMLRLLGARLQVRGRFKPGAKLIVANHVSWLDILAIHAACPEARFVSKADVKAWPLVNRLVAAGDTLYIEREKRRDAMRVVHQMADALRAGATVAVFPEGTTGLGPELLPFHANLLQAAVATGTPVQPVVLRFADRGGPFSEAAQYVGATTLTQSLWKLACSRDLVVHVDVLAPQGTEHADRRALAEYLRSLMAERLAV
jgi:1-acyl-sn-glycerol-3-phosphate acyltransferase